MMNVGYGAGVPAIWVILGHVEWWSIAVYAAVVPVLLWMTLRMHRGQKNHFMQMAAIASNFEWQASHDKQRTEWIKCGLCGQKKMCIDYLNKWMCEPCYGAFQKYWEKDNPYMQRGGLY